MQFKVQASRFNMIDCGRTTKGKSFASTLLLLCLSALLCFFNALPLYALTDAEITSYQKELADRPLSERIALWAERFLGTPYDRDPLGEYVTKKVIVADDRVDCMYLSFRALELALGHTPEESLDIALDKRFRTRGVLKGGSVVNYEDRFEYGEDMLDSKKWGKEITGEIGPLISIQGARGRERVDMVSKNTLTGLIKKWGNHPALKTGDFIFFIKAPEKRVSDEIVGHIGIVTVEGDSVYLIHASGRKKKGGEVKKILLSQYLDSMPFAGVRVSRFP
jgi:hypothetical protein